jgi:predicted O-methyltransferase YrrM
MLFDPKVAAVFQEYQARHEEEQELMKSLGAKGFASRDKFLLPIGIDAGRFLHSLILGKKPKRILEVGTSYGYSTLILADAAHKIGAKVITLELADYKQGYAEDAIRKAGLEESVEFRLGDAIESIENDDGEFDFVLMDIWKELYVPALKALYPKLADEAIIAADNMYDPPMHLPMAREYREFVRTNQDLQSTLLPIGSGIELTCKWPVDSERI